MYEVMIVDDEMLVRLGLKAMVDWNKLGFVIAGEAGNGQTAYEKFLVLKPDLVITDIKMPKKDGLWLTEKIKAAYPDTEIIILTCYDEFDYARRALKLRVADYILKAEMEEEDITSILLKKKEILDKRKSGKGEAGKAKVNEGDQLLGMLLNESYTMEEVDQLMNKLGISCQEKKSCFVVMDFSADLAAEKYSQEKIWNILTVCMELIENEMSGLQEQFFLKRLGKSIVVFLLDERLSEQKVQKSIHNIRESVGRYFSLRIKVARTPLADSISESRNDTEWLYDAANYMFYVSGDEVLTRDNYSRTRKTGVKQDKELYLKAASHLLEGDKGRALTKIALSFEQMKAAQKNSFDFKLTVTHLIADIAHELSVYLESPEDGSTYMRRMIQRDDLSQVIEIMEEFLDFMEARIVRMKVENSDILIRKAQAYIEEHYHEKITLDDVAGEVGISRYYFSTLFKQAAGINFSAYLNGIRINRAKELLKNKNMTISQVYAQVGFHDPQYFSKIFKKYTDMTVREYREQCGLVQ